MMLHRIALKGILTARLIVPDEPVDFAPNQRLLIHVQPLAEKVTDFRAWLGQGNAAPLNPAPRFKNDDGVWR